jgi:carbon-monoxide dehydrogenase large subunit
MEPRGATGAFDPATGDYTLTACTQGAGALRDPLAKVLGADPQRVRVVTEDVGGAFGMKTPVYPEYPALLVAAKAVGRPVHWMSTRGEAFLTDNQARDTLTEAALALDKDGRFLALRVRALADMGAYLSTVSAFIASSNFARCFPAVYDIPRIAVEVRCVFTNTVPTGPYRGAGRPEANYAMERVVEEAARLTGIDRVELRRHNLIRPETMPYRSAVGIVYDTGEFERVLDRALELSRYGEFPARRARSEDAGKRRGIGISCFVEHAGGQPREGAGLAFPADGRAELSIAAGASGQGHGTVFGRILAQRLGIPEKQIRVRQGDSRHGIEGAGSIASRSTMVTGAALVRVVDLVVEKGTAVAARMLEASELDIAYRGGAFEVPGTDRRVSLFDVAAEARASGAPLDEKTVTETPQTFPNGCHIAEVEVDPETGHVQVVGYAAVDDCGTPLDPVLIEGQLQGGVAQGLGQVVMENAIYDKATGQLLTASFMDYAMPRADDVPDVRGALHPLAATTNPLGVKGVGEAGTVGALAAITNAVADALPGAAAARLDMPATPERVWRAFNPG